MGLYLGGLFFLGGGVIIGILWYYITYLYCLLETGHRQIMGNPEQ